MYSKFLQAKEKLLASDGRSILRPLAILVIGLLIFVWAFQEIQFRIMVSNRNYGVIGELVANNTFLISRERAMKAIVSFMPDKNVGEYLEKQLLAGSWGKDAKRGVWNELRKKKLELPSGLRLLAQKKLFQNQDSLGQYYLTVYPADVLKENINKITADLVSQDDSPGLLTFVGNLERIAKGLGNEQEANLGKVKTAADKWNKAAQERGKLREQINTAKEAITHNKEAIESIIDKIHSATMTGYIARNFSTPIPAQFNGLVERHIELIDQTTRKMAENLSRGNPVTMVDVYADIASRLGDASLYADILQKRGEVSRAAEENNDLQGKLNDMQNQDSRLSTVIDSAKRTILDIVLVKQQSQRVVNSDNSVWAGTWNRINVDKWHRASITVSNVTDKDFHFAISAISGSHTGEISGIAAVSENQATFTKGTSTIMFALNGGILTVDDTIPLNYFGMGVSIKGNYQQGALKTETPTLRERGVLKDEVQEQAFINLVGQDYNKFTDCLQLVGEEKDLDQWGATVHSCAIRGLFTIKEAIVIVTPNGGIWAAVIDGDKVKYHTNRPNGKVLPRTIEKWRERFKAKEVVFVQ